MLVFDVVKEKPKVSFGKKKSRKRYSFELNLVLNPILSI